MHWRTQKSLKGVAKILYHYQGQTQTKIFKLENNLIAYAFQEYIFYQSKGVLSTRKWSYQSKNKKSAAAAKILRSHC